MLINAVCGELTDNVGKVIAIMVGTAAFGQSVKLWDDNGISAVSA